MFLASLIPVVLDRPTLTVESMRGRVDGLWRALEAVGGESCMGLPLLPLLPLLPALAALPALAVNAGAETFIESASAERTRKFH
ncbi:hypothetical protein [Saccharopolyspora hattusasensis]|uniref:hypothetical protein n=1 Tax=Saccharopolyspora hattusasensis TaxID=1128679 RepID=UPI003D98D852